MADKLAAASMYPFASDKDGKKLKKPGDKMGAGNPPATAYGAPPPHAPPKTPAIPGQAKPPEQTPLSEEEEKKLKKKSVRQNPPGTYGTMAPKFLSQGNVTPASMRGY